MNLSITQTIFLAIGVSVAITATLFGVIKILLWAWKKVKAF
jgi:hypothetical protein